VVSSAADWSHVYSKLCRDLKLFPVLGLDCEWVSQDGRVSPVSLLQLSTISGLCVLVRLCIMDNIPSSLKEILAKEDIYKVGVAVIDDKSKLLQHYALDVNGCVDIRHLVVQYSYHEGKLGLESLASLVLGVKLDKDWRLRASDWEAEILNHRQIDYAANDALVAVNIVWIIVRKHLTRTLRLWISSLFWSHMELVDQFVAILDRFADLKFSNSSVKAAQRLNNKERSSSPKVGALYQRRGQSTRASPLYHNCLLEAPDGQVLCACDVKKAKWYISKGIGVQVCEDPLTVRLKFEPSGRPEGKCGEYYLTFKPNICVVCGKDESFLRKCIVPHEYRKYFPTVMKDHQSHDVLLMCVQCHQKSNLYDLDVRKYLADTCEAPIGTEEDVKVKANFELKRVKSAGRALKCKREKIPEERLKELEDILKEHYEVDELTEDIIDDAANCNFNEENEEFVPHGRKVVAHYLKNGGLLQLEVLWRQHFLDKMKPQHLPPLWSVDHQEERLGVKAADNRIDLYQYQLATEGVASDLDLEAYRQSKQAQLGINPDLCHDSDEDQSEESRVR